jgi:hypothetical protein
MLNKFHQKSLDGNEEDWVKGRVYKGDKPWLLKFQGKDFGRKPSRLKKWIKGVLYGERRKD